MSYRPTDTELLLELLSQSEVFDAAAQKVIQTALEEEVLPLPDFEYILKVLKLEQNVVVFVDQRVDAMLAELKKKYSISE